MAKTYILLGSTHSYACSQNKLGTYIAWTTQKTEGFENGLIIDKSAFQRTIQNIIRVLEEQSRQTIKDIVISLYGSKFYTSLVETEIKLNNKSVDKHIMSKVEQNFKTMCKDNQQYLLHTQLREFMLDETIVNSPLSLKGQELKVLAMLCTTHISSFNNIIEALQEMHINIIDCIPYPFALGKCILSEDIQELGATVIDIGAHSTIITGFYKGAPLFCYTISFGGNTITRIIAQNLNISIHEAERIKKIYGAAMESNQDTYEWLEITLLSGKNICLNKMDIVKIVSSLLKDIAYKIKQAFAQEKVPPQITKRIVLYGGVSKTEKISELFESVLKCTVHDINHNSSLLQNFTSINDRASRGLNWYTLYSILEIHKENLVNQNVLEKVLKFIGFKK